MAGSFWETACQFQVGFASTRYHGCLVFHFKMKKSLNKNKQQSMYSVCTGTNWYVT